MKLTITLLITTSISLFYFPLSEHSILESLKKEAKISAKEYEMFKLQIDFKNIIGTNQRLDSLSKWNLDMVYTEEFYFFKKDSFLVKEYYFSSEKLKRQKGEKELYKPEKYYENGVLKSKYFFEGKRGKEYLQSILKQMKGRKTIDKISPIAKVEVVHAGCGMTWKLTKRVREEENKKYRKPKTPNYFLIETLTKGNNKKVSFQRPVKTKFKVIVEGHSF